MAKLPLIVTAKDDKNPTNTRVVPSDAAVHDTDTGITEFSNVALLDVEFASTSSSIAILDDGGNIKALQGTAENDVPVWNGTEWTVGQAVANIEASDPITVDKVGDTVTIGLDYTKLSGIPISAVTDLQDELDSKVPQTTHVYAGDGLTGGGELTGDVTISMPDVGAAGEYGSASSVAVITTDDQGRVEDAVDRPIQISQSQVTDLTSDLSLKADITYVDIQDTAVLASANLYAESLTYNISSKDSVHAATTIALPAYTFLNNVLTADVDGPLDQLYTDNHSLQLNQRLLVKNETNLQYNGIYYLSQLGDGSSPWKLTRSDDANTAAELCGANVPVEVGDTLGGSLWLFSANSSTFTINVDPVVWTQINVTVPDATTAVKGKIRLGGDLTGTADSPELIDIPTITPATYTRATVTVDAKGRVTDISADPIGDESIAYDFYFQVAGIPSINETVFHIKAVRAFYLTDNLSKYKFIADVAPSGGDAVLTLYVGGIATITATFADGSTTGTVAILGPLLVGAGVEVTVALTTLPYGITNISSGLGAVAGTNSIINAEEFNTRALKATKVETGAGLLGGGDLSADRIISMPDVGTAGVYGDAATVPVITTDDQGRVSNVVDTPIQIAQSQVDDLTTDLAAKVPNTRTVNGSNGIQGGGDLSSDVTLSPTYGTTAGTVCEGNDSRLSRTIPNDVAGQYMGKPSGSATIMDFVASRAFTIDSARVKFRCKAQATGSNVTMNIVRTRSGTPTTLATVTFTAGGGTTGTVGSFTSTAILEDDIISVVMTAIDSGATFSDPYMTIAGSV
jgi:hypothetical protein